MGAPVDVTCFASAILFTGGNVLSVIFFRNFQNRQHFNLRSFMGLDPTYLQEEWGFRQNFRPLEIALGITNAIAWFFFAIPMIKVAWIQSRRGTYQIGIHLTVAVLALGGSMAEMLSQLMLIGSMNALEWLTKDFELDNWTGNATDDMIGWRTVEVVYMGVRGMLLWIDAVENLFLCVIFGLIFVSVWNNHGTQTLKLKWAKFGAFLSVLSIIDFIASLMRFQNWRRGALIVFFINSLNRLIFFPVWLLWLGKQLPQAEALLERPKAKLEDAHLEITENASVGAENAAFS